MNLSQRHCFGLIKAYVATEGESPVELLERQARERIAETQRVLNLLKRQPLVRRLPWPNKALLLRLVLHCTHRAIALRERARLKQALLYSRCRQIALAIGKQLMALGYLEDRTDVFYMTYHEIDALLTGTAMFPYQVRELIQLRKRGHLDLSAMSLLDTFELEEGSYLDRNIGQRAQPQDKSPALPGLRPQANDATPTEMRGVGACGGSVTGPAAILKSTSELQLLKQGDVLVTRQTDPGWGPAFFLIKGLVIERGGMLSHGAILAREYGIPTVVGVRAATERISHRQTISVNGDSGVVQLTI